MKTFLACLVTVILGIGAFLGGYNVASSALTVETTEVTADTEVLDEPVSTKLDPTKPCQPGSFFTEDEQRFILIDKGLQKFGIENRNCYLYYDKETKVIYLFTYSYNSATFTPMLYETGEPLLFDEG